MGAVVPLRRMGFAPEATSKPFNDRGSLPAAVADAPLLCLSGGALAASFHSWFGRSGKRYICSIFPARGPNAGLPEFDAVVAIAVKTGRFGRRTRLGVFELNCRDGWFSAETLAAALIPGVDEWHIHFLAERVEARQAAILDLS